MEKEKEKKGLFERLSGSKKTKKNSCCCSFEIEELPEENADKKGGVDSPKTKTDSCCN